MFSINEHNEEREQQKLRESEREYGIEIGRDEERIANIKKMKVNLNLTVEQAMDALEIPEEKRREYLELIN